MRPANPHEWALREEPGVPPELWNDGDGVIYQQPLSANVGIGTNAPAYPLDISGTTRTDVLLAGNIGVGTDTPAYPVEIVGAIKADEYIGLPSEGQLLNPLWRRSGSNIYFHELGGPSQSNVGIGTDAPNYKLHVGLGETTKVVEFPSGTAVLIPYPPPGLSWQPISIQDGAKCRHYEANVTSISTDIQGLYAPGEYTIGINDGVDDNNGNQNASSQTNNVSFAFGQARGDFRSGLEMDFCLNNNADVQPPRNNRPISIFFASPNAIKLKKYLIQAGESTRGQPFMWQLYGYTRQLTYFDMRAGQTLTGGVLIHEVGSTGSLNNYDESLQFGMRSQRMALKWTGFRNEWQDTDTWDSKYLSRVYTPFNTTTAFKSFELRFLYIANLVFNTYIDRDGEILQDPVRNGKPKKAYHKDVNKNGDVYTYNLSIGNIRFFTEAESAQTQLVLQDQQSFQVNPDRWGFVASRNKTWENLWYLTKPTYSLDVSIFDTAKHTNELIPSPGVTYVTNPKRYVLTANDLFTIPATAVNEQGFSFYISLTPTGTGQVVTFETEWNPDRYIDGSFEYAVDIDFDPGLQYDFTWWDDIFANTGGLYLNTPAAYPFIRVYIEQDSVTAGKYNLVAVFYLYDDAQGVSRDDANATTPVPFVARVEDIALFQIQHFVFNVTPGFFYIYELVSSDGFILRAQVETSKIKPVLFKLCTIGNPENVDGLSGCPMSLYAFALFNAPLTYEQRDAIGDMIISDQLGNFNSVNANIQQDLSLPLLTYDPTVGYKLELDGSIVSAAALKIAVSERFIIGKDEIDDPQGTIQRLAATTNNDRLTVRGNTRMDGLATVSSNIVPWAGASPLIGEDSRRFSGIYLNDAVHLSNVSLTQSGNALRVGFGTSAGDFAAGNIGAGAITATTITCDAITADTYYNLPATAWSDITGKPSIFPTDWDSVSGKPSFFSGNYADLSGKPWAYSSGNILSQGGNVGIGTDATYTLNVGGNVNFSGELTKNGEPFLGIGDSIPVGAILPYYSATVSDPSYLICDGATYQRNDYIELANALGVNPAATTFTVPDLRDKFLKGKNADAVGATGGSATKTLTEANMPAHSHSGTTTSGEGTHTHTITDPGHQHEIGFDNGSGEGIGAFGTNYQGVAGPYAALDAPGATGRRLLANRTTTGISINSANSAHTHTFTTNTKGSGTAFDILPPYNVVIYVIKAKNNQYVTPIRDGDYWTNQANKLFYLSGNVGIGTNAPQALLDVNGNLRVGGQVVSAATQGTAPFVVGSTTLVGNLNSDLLDGQHGSFYLDYNNLTNKPTNTGSQWTTSGGTIYYNGGNVGIGTATPQEKFHVTGKAFIHTGTVGLPANGTYGGNDGTRIILWPGSSTATPYALGINGSTLWYGVPTGSAHRWFEGTTERMSLASGGVTISSGDNSITKYGPNSSWSSYLAVGAGTSRIDATTAQCISTNGNLHLDSATGKIMYLNYYRSGNGGSTNFDSIYSYGNQTHNGTLAAWLRPYVNGWHQSTDGKNRLYFANNST
ncbi:MAG: tail fiber protein, partial [Ilumatobacteraceae bacterium]